MAGSVMVCCFACICRYARIHGSRYSWQTTCVSPRLLLFNVEKIKCYQVKHVTKLTALLMKINTIVKITFTRKRKISLLHLTYNTNLSSSCLCSSVSHGIAIVMGQHKKLKSCSQQMPTILPTVTLLHSHYSSQNV